MSVFVKGIKMPSTEGCEVIIRIQPDGTVLNATGIHLYAKAVEIPPHGRLIDADVVAQDLQEMSEDIERSFPYLNKNDALMVERGIAFARQYVLNLAPTIIEAEED